MLVLPSNDSELVISMIDFMFTEHVGTGTSIVQLLYH